MIDLDAFLAEHESRLVALRRDLHRHPELSGRERRTTARIADELRVAGLDPQPLPGGTGLLCDIGDGPPRTGLRADLDALPVQEESDAEYRSIVPGVAHACGHDVHAAAVLGAGLALAGAAARARLARPVRLVFQPAEEVLPGGALDVVAAGGLDGLERVYALHCDPTLEVGRVGLRAGPITAASDHVELRLSGPGGHTARPHRTADVVGALGDLLTRLPAILTRRVDPRSGASLVWGQVNAGGAANVVPKVAVAAGTLRVLDRDVWHALPALVEEVARSIAGAYRVELEVVHTRGVPPVVNDADAVAELAAAAARWLGPDSVAPTAQSLGGEDFGWMVEKVPGALARLGVGTPGSAGTQDLHQPGFAPDERAIAAGVRLLAGVALQPAEW